MAKTHIRVGIFSAEVLVIVIVHKLVRQRVLSIVIRNSNNSWAGFSLRQRVGEAFQLTPYDADFRTAKLNYVPIRQLVKSNAVQLRLYKLMYGKSVSAAQ